MDGRCRCVFLYMVPFFLLMRAAVGCRVYVCGCVFVWIYLWMVVGYGVNEMYEYIFTVGM